MDGFRKTLFYSALCFATAAVGACREEQSHQQTSIRVEAGPPKVQDVDVTLRYPIELQADESVAITPVAISGFLRRVLVDVGDKVKGGQLIALVDCREYKAKRTQAETVIVKRKAQVDESRSQLDRLERMGETLVAPAEIDQAKAEARVAEAELADARAKLSEAGQRQGYCSLTAPFSGFVSERFLDPGAMVSPGGRPVVNIVKTREVRVVASIIEADAPKVTRGAEVDLVLHAFPDQIFRAEVSRMGRALDPSTRTLRVEMDIPNTTELLLPGMTGRAAIVVGKREKALLVPVSAILQLEDVAYVYVAREQGGETTAHRVEVELGVDLGDWIEVTKGISATDQVIMVGRELVGEGTTIEVSEAVNRPQAAPKPKPATPEPGKVVVESDGAPPEVDAGGTGGDTGGETSGPSGEDAPAAAAATELVEDAANAVPAAGKAKPKDKAKPKPKDKPKPKARASTKDDERPAKPEGKPKPQPKAKPKPKPKSRDDAAGGGEPAAGGSPKGGAAPASSTPKPSEPPPSGGAGESR